MSGCWVERRGGARPRTPQTRFLSNSETSPAPTLRPGPRRGQTAESWIEWAWAGVPASQVPGGSPGLMPAPPPTGRTVSGKPRDPEATPVPETPELVRPDPAGLTLLSSEGSAASVCAIRVRSVLLLVQREHPAAPAAKAPVGWAPPPRSPAPRPPPPPAQVYFPSGRGLAAAQSGPRFCSAPCHPEAALRPSPSCAVLLGGVAQHLLPP